MASRVAPVGLCVVHRHGMSTPRSPVRVLGCTAEFWTFLLYVSELPGMGPQCSVQVSGHCLEDSAPSKASPFSTSWAAVLTQPPRDPAPGDPVPCGLPTPAHILELRGPHPQHSAAISVLWAGSSGRARQLTLWQLLAGVAGWCPLAHLRRPHPCSWHLAWDLHGAFSLALTDSCSSCATQRFQRMCSRDLGRSCCHPASEVLFVQLC